MAAGLGEMEREFRRLSTVLRKLSEVPAELATEGAAEIQTLLNEEYAAGKDPYDRPWAPLKPSTLARGRTPPPLTDTRYMRDTTKAAPLGGAQKGIGVTIEPEYIKYHQTGTSRMAARPVFPTGGMPTRWEQALERVKREAFEERVK